MSDEVVVYVFDGWLCLFDRYVEVVDRCKLTGLYEVELFVSVDFQVHVYS